MKYCVFCSVPSWLLLIVAILLLMSFAFADDHRIHPICDDTKTPRCWVPHPGENPKPVTPVPPVTQSESPRVRVTPPESPPPVQTAQRPQPWETWCDRDCIQNMVRETYRRYMQGCAYVCRWNGCGRVCW
jgi:hypothetical protein